MVALRKESVDRNVPFDVAMVPVEQVALRKESVDRNRYLGIETDPLDWSLSARRAWIEIRCMQCFLFFFYKSLSARRAWIEMLILKGFTGGWKVALRKESVDRNCGPQGSGKTLSMSLSARRAWIEISTQCRL